MTRTLNSNKAQRRSPAPLAGQRAYGQALVELADARVPAVRLELAPRFLLARCQKVEHWYIRYASCTNLAQCDAPRSRPTDAPAHPSQSKFHSNTKFQRKLNGPAGAIAADVRARYGATPAFKIMDKLSYRLFR